MTKESNISGNGSPISLMPYLNARIVNKGLSDIMLELFLEDPNLTTDELLSLGQKFKELDLSKDEDKIIYKLFLEKPDLPKDELISLGKKFKELNLSKDELGISKHENKIIYKLFLENPDLPKDELISKKNFVTAVSKKSGYKLDTFIKELEELSINNNLNHVQSTKKSLTRGLEILNNSINENSMEGTRADSPCESENGATTDNEDNSSVISGGSVKEHPKAESKNQSSAKFMSLFSNQSGNKDPSEENIPTGKNIAKR